jgi:hypothetical protein
MAGPDLYLEIDESVLNETLAAAWQTGLASYAGKLSFADMAPPSLTPYAEVAFRVTLNGEPLIDMRQPKQVFAHCDAKLELLVLTLVPLTFDLAFHVETEATLDASLKEVSFTPVAVGIDRLVIRDQIKVTDEFLKTLNTMLSTALLAYVGSAETTISLPKISIDVPLPLVPDGPGNRMPVALSECAVLDNKRLAVGVIFLTDTVPVIPQIPAASTAPIFISLRQQAMRDVLDFWWNKVDWSIPIPFTGTMPLNASQFVNQARSILTRLVTLGFLQREEDISNMVLAYTGQVYLLSKPDLLFTAPDAVGVGNLSLKVVLDVRITADVTEKLFLDTSSVIPDTWTPWTDDIKLSEKSGSQEIIHLQQTVELSLLEAAAALAVQADGNLALKVQKADLALEFGNEWYQNLPESLLNGLLKFFNQKIIDHLPPLVIAPAVVLKNVKAAGLTPVVTPRLFQVCAAGSGLYGEATVAFATGFDVAELAGKVPVPGYIANRRSHRVHRVTCAVIKDIRPEHREGYFVLHEALRDGYRSCQECLKGAVIS